MQPQAHFPFPIGDWELLCRTIDNSQPSITKPPFVGLGRHEARVEQLAHLGITYTVMCLLHLDIVVCDGTVHLQLRREMLVFRLLLLVAVKMSKHMSHMVMQLVF